MHLTQFRPNYVCNFEKFYDVMIKPKLGVCDTVIVIVTYANEFSHRESRVL